MKTRFTKKKHRKLQELMVEHILFVYKKRIKMGISEHKYDCIEDIFSQFRDILEWEIDLYIEEQEDAKKNAVDKP